MRRLSSALYEANMKAWSKIKEEFDADGSLRDICVEDVDPGIWEVFIGNVKSSEFRLEFTHGGESVNIPNTFAEVKQLQEADPTILHIWLNEEIHVNCHFFCETEIELDVSPREIQGEPEYEVLTDFLDWLASRLGRKVVLTHENSPDRVILSVG